MHFPHLALAMFCMTSALENKAAFPLLLPLALLPSRSSLLLHRDAREESFTVLGKRPRGSALAMSWDIHSFPPATGSALYELEWTLNFCLSESLSHYFQEEYLVHCRNLVDIC